MEFIGSIFSIVAVWLGFGNTPPPPTPPSPPSMIEEKNELSRGAEAVAKIAEENDSTELQTADVAVDVPAEATLVEPDTTTEPVAPASPITTMLVAGGCFWCVEADMEKTKGVISAVSGYAGGTTENPTYENYGSGGHREVVEVTYDASQISFEEILIVAMKTTDPTDDDGTFADRGDKYSSAFYYENANQKAIIDNLIAEVNEYGPYDQPLAIDVEPRATFWPAEEYHQDYYKGALSQLKYKYYRNASGRDDFIKQYWGVNDHSPSLPWRNQQSNNQTYMWSNYTKPSQDQLKSTLDPLVYKVTQEDGTERAGTSPLDKVYERGIYVDVLSGEPLYSSRDKYDSGTGWPSFTKPITPQAVTEHEDRKLFVTRTEIRSTIADNHLGHVFTDGPQDSTGLRYCMNGAALEFVPESEMEARGYSDFLQYL